jgi:hypothetical protein
MTDRVLKIRFPAGVINPYLLQAGFRPTKPAIQWVAWALFPGVKRPDHNTHFHLVMTLRMNGAIPLLHHTLP